MTENDQTVALFFFFFIEQWAHEKWFFNVNTAYVRYFSFVAFSPHFLSISASVHITYMHDRSIGVVKCSPLFWCRNSFLSKWDISQLKSRCVYNIGLECAIMLSRIGVLHVYVCVCVQVCLLVRLDVLNRQNRKRDCALCRKDYLWWIVCAYNFSLIWIDAIDCDRLSDSQNEWNYR